MSCIRLLLLIHNFLRAKVWMLLDMFHKKLNFPGTCFEFLIIMLNHEQSFNPFLYHINLLHSDDTRLADLKGLQIVT